MQAIAQAQAEETAELDIHPSVWCLDFSRDGKWLAAATSLSGRGAPIVVWRVADWKPHIVRFEKTGGLHVAFSPDSRLVAYCTRDQRVVLIDAATGKLEREIEAHSALIYCVVFTPDGKSLVTSSGDRTIKFWDVATGSLKRTFDGIDNTVSGVAVSPDGAILVSGDFDRYTRLWDVATGKVKQSFGPWRAITRRVRFCRDGRHILSSSYGGYTRVRETATGRLVMKVGGNDSADMTADNQYLVTSGSSDAAFVFRVGLRSATQRETQRIKELIRRFGDDDYETREAASAEVRKLGLVAEPLLCAAMDSEDAEVRLRARRTRAQIRSPEPIAKLAGHRGNVEYVCFSPDGQLLATGCRGGDIKIWSVPEFRELLTLHAPTKAGAVDK